MEKWNIFKQYKGLRREIYVLFYGRIVTNMGSLIWPMLTLILTNKLGMNASDVAGTILLMSVIQLPCVIIGGKIADRFNKRNVIIVSDLITVACYIACFFMEMSMPLIWVFFLGSVFANLEHPSYDALVADLSTTDQREKAYSLSYLGANLGLVLAPSLGGFLFENHLQLAFLITAVSTLSSTILIFLLIKDVSRSHEASASHYETDAEQGLSTMAVLKKRPLILFYFLCGALYMVSYSQFNFLIPINLERLYSAQGAVIFGTLTTLNCILCVVCTPLLTTWFARLHDTGKMIAGGVLVTLGLSFYIFAQGKLPLYYVSMIIFTLGEVFSTLGRQPYLTRRIPATHRGRVASISSIVTFGIPTIAQKGIGALADKYDIKLVWCVIVLLGVAGAVLYCILHVWDKRRYPLLHKSKQAANDGCALPGTPV